MLSSSIFECIPCAGKIAKDNFPWQMLGNKKIVLGEEIFVTQVNIDKYKDLLSGSKATCERKGTTPAYCKADGRFSVATRVVLVFLNLNDLAVVTELLRATPKLRRLPSAARSLRSSRFRNPKTIK